MPSKSKFAVEKIDPRRLLNLLSSRHSLDWWVFTLYCVPAIEAQAVFDYGRLGGDITAWVAVALASLAVMAVMWLLARMFLLGKREFLNPYAILIFFTLAGFVRGVVLHELAHGSGLEDDQQIAYRYVIAPIFTVVLLGTLAVVVVSIRQYQDSIRELTKDRAKLRLASINLKSEIEKTHTELQTTIFGILSPAIKELERRLEAVKDQQSLSRAIDALKVTVEDVVRPLSHKIAETSFEQLVLETNQTIRQDSRQQRYKLRVTLRPLWSALIATMVGLGPALVSNSNNSGVVVVVVLGVTVYFVLMLVRSLVGKRLFSIAVAGLITVFSYTVSITLFILISGFFETDPTLVEQTQMLVLMTLLGAVMFIFEWSAAYRNRNLESARAVNERFEILNSRLRRQVWLDHRRMASILHGQLQGALYAAAIRLNQSGEPNHFLIENVKSEIQQAVAELTRETSQDHRFDVVLEQLLEMWDDVVDFETKFDRDALEELASNSEASECAIEVIREAINNAVKHGKAKRISLELHKLSAALVELKITNEGQQLSEQATAGFGSSVMDEYTHRWSRKSTPTGVELSAQVLI